jgi:hypothetical protein
MATRHGHGRRGRRSPTYNCWLSMRARCLNPKHAHWADYGGRGITIDPRWSSYEAFLADMGERPEGRTLDRIDGAAGYTLGNCRWATESEQNRNRRRQRRCSCGYFAPHTGPCQGQGPPDDDWREAARAAVEAAVLAELEKAS